MLIALWAIVTITFFIMHAIPGDPFLNPRVPEHIRQAMLNLYGLNKPLWEQYFIYIANLLRGNLGTSLVDLNRTVTSMIATGFPVSATLGLEALLFAVTTGLALGIIASLYHNRTWDYVAMIIALIGISVPNFVVATVLQYVVGVKWGILPVSRWGDFQHSILPAFALGLSTLALMARMMRTSMLDVLNQDYIRTAKSKGLPTGQVIWRHAVRNALLPIVTILGPLVATIVTGTFVIEQIFGIPGLGSYYVASIYNRDYPLILGTTIFYAVILLLMNFLVDIAYGLIDPRIRLVRERD
ncbi:MAG: Binding-protein-dependent transport systems inner membrane component [Clostridia bacterium 62_21]|nr:MAG: Binding-protein-dependent transport systems inner membrane component [Clostridia bacterium 62_21]